MSNPELLQIVLAFLLKGKLFLHVITFFFVVSMLFSLIGLLRPFVTKLKRFIDFSYFYLTSMSFLTLFNLIERPSYDFLNTLFYGILLAILYSKPVFIRWMIFIYFLIVALVCFFPTGDIISLHESFYVISFLILLIVLSIVRRKFIHYEVLMALTLTVQFVTFCFVEWVLVYNVVEEYKRIHDLFFGYFYYFMLIFLHLLYIIYSINRLKWKKWRSRLIFSSS